jgi:hypothetical protein
MYALNVRRSPEIAGLLSETDLPFGNNFIAWLAESARLKLVAYPTRDDVILYSTVNGPRHAGRWDVNSVVSKWGLGHLWRHGVFEVRSSYGDIIQTYAHVDPKPVAHWFAEYVRDNE